VAFLSSVHEKSTSSQLVGSDVNAKDATGATPIHRACSALALLAVEALMDAGARLTETDTQGNTPLHVAVDVATDRAGANVAIMLVQRGAPLDVPNKEGQTPLDLAGENAALLKSAARADEQMDIP
jgi:ankyrin repeat protein